MNLAGGGGGASELGRASASSGEGLRTTTDTLGPNGEVRGSVGFMDVGRSISGFWNYGAGVRGAGRVSVEEQYASAGYGGRFVRAMVPGLMRGVTDVRPAPGKLATAPAGSVLPPSHQVQMPVPMQMQMQVPAQIDVLGYGVKPVTPMSSMQHAAASLHPMGHPGQSLYVVQLHQSQDVAQQHVTRPKASLRAVEKLDREARIAAVVGLVVLIVMIVILVTR